jgi:hypothetical protein
MLLRGKIPQRKKGFSALCIFDIGGDSMSSTPKCHQPNLGRGKSSGGGGGGGGGITIGAEFL